LRAAVTLSYGAAIVTLAKYDDGTMTGVRTPDQLLLGALLGAVERRTPFRRPPGVSDAHLVALARHHRLSPLLSLQDPTAGGLSGEVVETFRRDRLATLGRSTLHRHALAEILAECDAAAVDVAVLKGIAYDDLLYPEAGTRPASDVDLLVRGPERRRAMEVLTRLGYTPSASAPGFDEPDYHEVSFRRDVVNVDLHLALAPLVRCSIDYPALWAAGMQTWELAGRRTTTLDFVHAALNQALHMAIHHFDVPALYLLDLRRLVARCGREVPGGPTAAWARLRAAARAWGCERPLATAAALVAAFLPAAEEAAGGPVQPVQPRGEAWVTRRVVEGFGGVEPVSRAEQLGRKLLHFDDGLTATRYLWVQGRRILRERWLGYTNDPRSAAERLGLAGVSPSGSR
jgi:hypothetical protein